MLLRMVVKRLPQISRELLKHGMQASTPAAIIENEQMGHGLKNMQKRATAIGAQLEIHSAHQQGTEIVLYIKTT